MLLHIRARDDPNALRAGTRLGLYDLLVKHNAMLDTIQRGLDEYLESKCALFPRFYFISSEELLQVRRHRWAVVGGVAGVVGCS